MARRQRAERRDVEQDPRYGSPDVTKFVNTLMNDGKKAKAEKIFYEAMRLIEERTGQPALNVFQVPMEVHPPRRDSLARRWIVYFARQRSDKDMSERLAKELMDAAKGEGGAVRRKDEVHRMAEANKAFAHYRW